MDSNLKIHNFTPTLKLSLDKGRCKFYHKAEVTLLQICLLKRDNTYLEPEELAAGKQGWMSCGTLYFKETEEGTAIEEFDRLVSQLSETHDYRITSNRSLNIDDLPVDEQCLKAIEMALFTVRAQLQSCPEGSLGKWISYLRMQDMNLPLMVQSPNNCLVSHEVDDFQVRRHVRENGEEVSTINLRLKGRTE